MSTDRSRRSIDDFVAELYAWRALLRRRPSWRAHYFTSELPCQRAVLRCDESMEDASSEPVGTPNPVDLVGTYSRFGASGPVYEVIGAGVVLPADERRVVESGEQLDYRLAEILDACKFSKPQDFGRRSILSAGKAIWTCNPGTRHPLGAFPTAPAPPASHPAPRDPRSSAARSLPHDPRSSGSSPAGSSPTGS